MELYWQVGIGVEEKNTVLRNHIAPPKEKCSCEISCSLQVHAYNCQSTGSYEPNCKN